MVEKEVTLSVPIINIEALLQGPELYPDEFQKVVTQIEKACTEWGFFYIVNHGINPLLIKKINSVGIDFFSRPTEFKKTVARKEGNFQGYYDNELTKQKVDWKEGFDFSSDKELPENVSKFGIHGVNQLPEGMPEFRETLNEYFEEMDLLSKKLMEAVVKTLISDDHFVSKCFADGGDTSFCRLNHYPTCPNTSENLGVGPHSDAGVLTVLYQDGNVTSLQVEKDGIFYDVPPVPDSFVINIGDMTQVWSNGKYKAPVHRVLANNSKPRFSIPFFLNPSYSCIVEPLKDIIDKENPIMYRPIMWGEFRKGRVLGDYADHGEELQISHYLINKNQH